MSSQQSHHASPSTPPTPSPPPPPPQQPRLPLHGRIPQLLGPFARLPSYLWRAIRAAAWPVEGIWYFCCHPSFYPLFLGRLMPLSIISFLVYFVLFTFAFLPQYAFLAIFHGWGAWISALVLVLGEGLVIIQGLFEGFFVDECRVDVFDATLINHGLRDLIAPHRILFSDAPNTVKMLGKPTSHAEYQPWSLIQMVELVVFLPLNLIPYVGSPAFILIAGRRLGVLSHHRWYKLRGLTNKEIKNEVRSRSWDYLWFGTVAMVLELVPILSFLFLLTSATGSALWVARMEDRRKARTGQRMTTEEQAAAQAADAEGPHYRDDPV